ncbi:MAG: GNAT family N-acetyltransferase [Bacillota bacterium]
MEIRELRSLTARDLQTMGYGYISNSKYEVRRVEKDGRITIIVEPVQLAEPYVKVWPCPDDFIEDQNQIIGSGMSLGAYIHGGLVGVVVAQPRRWNNTMGIDNIHIDARYRNMGFGTRLMAAIEDIARRNGFRIIGLETQNTNAPAIAFYMKLGFTLDGLDVSFYSNNKDLEGEIAFFMKKHVRA